MAAARERRVQVHTAPGFKQRYRRFLKTHPEIKQALRTFNESKHKIPPVDLPLSMSDHVLKFELAGLRECHLSDDVLLVYTHKDDVVNMIDVCSHDELKREDATIKRIAKDMQKAAAKAKAASKKNQRQ